MSIPSITCPKTTCLLFKKGVAVVVTKNWQPLVFGPEFCQLVLVPIVEGYTRGDDSNRTYSHAKKTLAIMS